MDFILCIIIALICGLIYWIGYGLLNFFGLLNNGNFKMNLKKSFYSVSLKFFLEDLPVFLFMSIVVLAIANIPLLLILTAIDIKTSISNCRD